MTRCPWAKTDLSISYHDREWGVPVRNDLLLFEFLILEGAQAGLSWETILAKRENYRQEFDGFDPERIARYSPKRIASILKNPGIVRNRLKVESAVANAREFMKLIETHGDGAFAAHLWSFVGGGPIVNRWTDARHVPASTAESAALSKDLKKRGFRFVGPTICYTLMQATGLVNDHLVSCPRHKAVGRGIKAE